MKSHHRVISDGLTRMAWKTWMTRVTGMAGETRITSVAKGRLG